MKKIAKNKTQLDYDFLFSIPGKKKFLENKIYFEKFLKKNEIPSPDGVIIKNASDINLLKKFPAVLQVPLSHGGQGTFFIKNKSDLKRIVNKNNLGFPLLCREFIDGIPIGVTLIIGEKQSIFSTLRMQAIELSSKKLNKFLGVQWLKTSNFDQKTIKNLNSVLKKLTQALRSIKFRGIANIDLIIKSKNSFIIECNPRFSLGTLQLWSQRELMHNLDFIREFKNSINSGHLTKNLSYIPDTSYQGCILDLDYFGQKLYGKKLKNYYEKGFYKIENNQLRYASSQFNNFEKKDYIFIDHELTKNKQLNLKSDFGLAIINKPMFKVGRRLILSKTGAKMKKIIEKFIQKEIEIN